MQDGNGRGGRRGNRAAAGMAAAAPAAPAARVTGGAAGPGRRPWRLRAVSGFGFAVMLVIGYFYALSVDAHPRRLAVRRRPGVPGLLPRRQHAGRHVRRERPADPAAEPDPDHGQERHGRRGGQALLRRGRRLAGRYRPGRHRRPDQRVGPAGRVHHHPAAGPELLHGHRHRGDRQPEDQGNLRRGEAGPGEIQALDPHQLHEHGADRGQQHVRLRRGGRGVLRGAGQEADRRAGRDDRGHAAVTQLLQPRPEGGGGLPGAGVPLALRAADHGRRWAR